MKIKDLFSKELRELESSDLETYFQDPLEESDIIEYKSFEGEEGVKEREKKILRTICSFLNSSGGILIWGAPGEKGNVLQKELSPIDHVIKKDHFIAKVLNRIIPSPSGVRCEVILVGEDKCVLVFEVEESKNRPHQFENIYYMRADGQTIKAPHHYVEALFKQVRYPILNGYLFFQYEGFKLFQNEEGMWFIDAAVRVEIYNETPFINERNLCVTILIGHTVHEMENRVIPVLHHGGPISIPTTLRLPIWMSRKMQITLLFGGELSPLCSSRYLIECGVANTYEGGLNGKVVERRPWAKEIKSELNKFYFETEEGPLREG
jgi:hypothetical protein